VVPTRRPADASSAGLGLMLAATASFVAMTAFVKILREGGMGTPEVMFWRMAPGLPWMALALAIRRVALRPADPAAIALRSAFGLTAMAANFYAVRALSLVQHNLLHLLQPIFVALLAPVLIRERLGAVAVIALVLACGGAVAAIDPRNAGGALHPWAVAAGVGAALFSALAHIWVRRTTARDDPELVVFHFTLAVTVVSLAASSGEIFRLPSGLDARAAVLAVAGMAGCGLLGQILMTRAYDRAAAPIVAVVAYASIPLNFAVDAIVWGAPGSLGTIVGAGLMVLAGVLLVRAPRDPAPG
jgi:drug/metabolite transporter (DMT)-like permease